MYASTTLVGFRPLVRLLLRRPAMVGTNYIAELKEELEDAEERLRELEK